MLAAAGKSVRKGVIGECNIKDIASVVLSAFGLEQPDTWTSRVPAGLFTDIEGGKARPVEAAFEPPKARTHLNAATPEDSLERIESIIGRVRAYYPFDGSLKDVRGDNGFEYDGKIYYTEGYHGSCATLNDARIFNGMTFGEGDTTMSCWIRMYPPACEKTLLSNMIRNEERREKGFTVTLGTDHIGVRIFDDEGKKVRGIVSYPENEYDGWFHLLFSVDRERNKLSVYVDFELIGEYGLTDGLKGTPLGKGRLESQNGGMPVSLDELIITEAALSQEQVSALAEYYGA